MLLINKQNLKVTLVRLCRDITVPGSPAPARLAVSSLYSALTAFEWKSESNNYGDTPNAFDLPQKQGAGKA